MFLVARRPAVTPLRRVARLTPGMNSGGASFLLSIFVILCFPLVFFSPFTSSYVYDDVGYDDVMMMIMMMMMMMMVMMMRMIMMMMIIIIIIVIIFSDPCLTC